MGAIIPYVVFILVVLVFLGLCYWLFRDTPETVETRKKQGKKIKEKIKEGRRVKAKTKVSAKGDTLPKKKESKSPLRLFSRKKETKPADTKETLAKQSLAKEPRKTEVTEDTLKQAKDLKSARAMLAQAYEEEQAEERRRKDEKLKHKELEGAEDNRESLEATQIIPDMKAAEEARRIEKEDTRKKEPLVRKLTPDAKVEEEKTLTKEQSETTSSPVVDKADAAEGLDDLEKPVQLEMTRRIPAVTPAMLEKETAVPDATMVLPTIKQAARPAIIASPKPVDAVLTTSDDLPDYVAPAMTNFMSAFAGINNTSRQSVEEITGAALEALGLTDVNEVKALLENIVIQEALLCMQKAYVATPTDWMHETAIAAFIDVVQQPKSSTPYLVAFDALRILPRLHLGHFQIMAIALLLQYSRNSNNYSIEHFRHYVKKYIKPFVSHIPADKALYQQLDYLRCSVQESEQVTFKQIMAGSYPFMFSYRGFTKEELSRALNGEKLPAKLVVKSLNSSLYKLAVVDEGLFPRFFRLAGISDRDTQQQLIRLSKSRPVTFDGMESDELLEHISPVLSDLAELYDSTPMSHMSLTLLGLYLGRLHVKVMIGEEFDLSTWF